VLIRKLQFSDERVQSFDFAQDMLSALSHQQSKESGPKGPDLRVSGVGCQVSGKKNKKTET
jgi:hypothetical protein